MKGRERERERRRFELTAFPEAVSMLSTNTRMAISNDTARLK